MKSYYTTIKVDTWETARKIQLCMCKATKWIFRGQSNSEWELKTNFERQVECYQPYKSQNGKSFYNKEKFILEEFKKRAHFYNILLSENKNLVEWFSLLQHYGGPTRFLDFTYSFYVAAFFSMERTSSDSAIWALNLEIFNEVIEKVANTIQDEKFYDEDEYFDSFAFANYILNNQFNENLVTYVIPDRMHERQSIQQGLFIFPCNLNSTFIENLNSTIEKISMKDRPNYHNIKLSDKINYSIFNSWPLVKIIIQKDCHNSALYDLKDMNISSATLFPGLDGFARSLSIYFRDNTFDGEFDRAIKNF